jgi:hypothetical protein
MLRIVKDVVRVVARVRYGPKDVFLSYRYQRHNQRCQEHLASLGLPISGCSVLEVGAGIGDHTSFFIDRGCTVVATEPRAENREVLAARYPNVTVRGLDLDVPDRMLADRFDIVYCYGTLYHLQDPDGAIRYLGDRCDKMLLLETCVSYGEEPAINSREEDERDFSQSVHGQGCRPTRRWVHDALKAKFDFVYMPKTQPWHDEFPLDWTRPPEPGKLTRAVFVASRQLLHNESLVEGIVPHQVRG